ncbi:MAG: XisI protein [Anaerolineae bacterium]|jgi:hypothetical protein|nr:XisI protein [Anaerolineae bacterium]
MESLATILHQELDKYRGSGFGANCRLLTLSNPDDGTYTLLVTDYPVRQNPAEVVILARLMDDSIIIEEDNTNKPLIEALLQRNIPRAKIVLAYAGETPPTQERP